jgi:hypothetical protein
MHLHKRFGLFRHPQIQQQIAQLDAVQDCQQIVRLLAQYEFPHDIQHALELALFYTYGSQSVSKLLNKTGEFRRSGQKRYDDTRILIGLLLESGWDGDFGQKALARINQTHGHYFIHHDDFLFVLWTFIEFPIRWSQHYSHRVMTTHEQLAWFNFWVGIGQRMNMVNIPSTKADLDTWVTGYQWSQMWPSADNHAVANQTAAIMEAWLPSTLQPLVKLTIRGLMDDHFLYAIGYPTAPTWLKRTCQITLKLYHRLYWPIFWEGYPLQAIESRNPYDQQSLRAIHEIAPERLKRLDTRSSPKI